MYGAFVRFVVKAGKRDEFLELLRWDARWPGIVSPALCDWAYGRSKRNLTWCTSTKSIKTLGAFEDHTKNAPVQKFTEIMSSLVEGWTMVIPFGESVTSNVDE